MLPSCQRRYQHDERGLRQVEIGDQRVHDLKAIAGIDEDIRPAGAGPHGAILRRLRLHGAAACGTHADDPAAVFLRLVDKVCRLLRDDTVFAVHGVVGDLLLLHRAESTKSHMECNVSDLYTHLLNFLQQLRCKMQSGGGGGGRAVHLGVDGLIPLPIL